MIGKFYRMAVNANRLIAKNAKNIGKVGGTSAKLVPPGKTPFVEGLAGSHRINYSEYSRLEQNFPNCLYTKIDAGSVAELVAKKTSPNELKLAGRIAPRGIITPGDTTFSGTLSSANLKNGTHIDTLDMKFSRYTENCSGLENSREIADVIYKGNNKLGSRVINYPDQLENAKLKDFYDKNGEWIKTVFYREDGTRCKAVFAESGRDTLYYNEKGLPVSNFKFNPAFEKLI